MKKRVLLLAITLLTFIAGYSQNIDVNPSVKWKFIRSQDLEFRSGRTYQYEFPAEKGYDYIFNITHNQPKAAVSMTIYDLQYKPINNLEDSATVETRDITFRVTENGTYLIMLTITAGDLDASLPSKLTLIRRPTIGY